jgi:hypothetical protein
MKYKAEIVYKGLDMEIKTPADTHFQDATGILAKIKADGDITIRCEAEINWMELWLYSRIVNKAIKFLK